MSIDFPGHWTDEQLIDHLYGVGPADGHLSVCRECTERVAAMQTHRQQMERHAPVEETVSPDLLAAQRRAIYAKISAPYHWWSQIPVRRWVSGVAMITVLTASLTIYRQHQLELSESKVDAQLAQDVSRLAFDSEPQATAPLEALFVE